MKQRKKVGATIFTSAPQQPSARHEIDALIHGIGSFLKKKPEKVIKALELWVNDPKSHSKEISRKKAG